MTYLSDGSFGYFRGQLYNDTSSVVDNFYALQIRLNKFLSSLLRILYFKTPLKNKKKITEEDNDFKIFIQNM